MGMGTPKSTLVEFGTRSSEGRPKLAGAANVSLDGAEDSQRALLNILDDFAAEKSRLEQGQRAMLNILDDFDSEKERMEGAQRAVLNILEDSVAEKSELGAAQSSMLNILDDFVAEKTQFEALQRSVVNILEDFAEEKGRLEETQSAVLNILDDFEAEKNKVELANQQLGREIEERKRAEQQVKGVNAELLGANEALRQSQERYQLLFDSNPHPLWVYDLETLRILDINASAIQHYGYSREEFVGLTILDIRPPEDVPAVLESIANSGTQAIHHAFWKHRKKNGALMDVEVTSHPLLYGGRPARVVVSTDITERRQAEKALEASEQKFRSVVETANDAIITADAGGNITDFNGGAEAMFGYSAGEVVGQLLTLLMPERFKEAHHQGLARFFKTGEARVIRKTVELVGRKKDGREFPLTLSLSTWKTHSGVFFTGIVADITERKRSEQEILRRSAELEAANKELEAFSYSVSHDLRAPLRGIDGFSLALLEDCADKLDQDGRDYLQRVRAATQRMGVLIDDLLNLSRVTRSEMRIEKTDLGAMARRVATELQNMQPERRAEFRIEEGLVAFVDSHLMRIVLENLLGNAWKFSSKRESPHIEFGKADGDGRPTYYVRDDGAGFDPAYADRLFGAFQRLHDKSDFPGTGVGLATVQRIIHRHGGHIWAEGAVDRGATFYFTLSEATSRSNR